MILPRLLAAAASVFFCIATFPAGSLAQDHPVGHYRWVAMTSNDPLPNNLIGGGICRVAMHGGVHPGKLLSDIKTCNVGWNNSGDAYHQFEVFTGDVPGYWLAYKDGDPITPQLYSDVLVGGRLEDGTSIYVCKGFDGGIGTHIGKLVAQNCNVEYGGKEVILSSGRQLFYLNPASVIENPALRRKVEKWPF